MTGCGKQIHIVGTNGGTMPCGSRLSWPNGESAREYCDSCKEQQKQAKIAANKRHNDARKARNEAYRSCGLVRVRGNLGGIYWE